MAAVSSERTASGAASIAFDGRTQRIGERLIVRFPGAASARLPSRGQVAADVELNGHSFGTVIEPDGRRGHWLAVPDELERALSLEDDDAVTVVVTPTKAWPEPRIPADLDAALADAPDIAGVWEDITPMARWEWVRWVNSTKNPGTRARRVEVSISKMRSGKRRPCCFDLTACTDPELAKSGKLVEG